jgi:hypothetical protein
LVRAFKYFFRNPQAFATKVVQLIAFAFFSILLYTDIRKPETDTVGAIQDLGGLSFTVTGTMAFGGVFGSILGIIPLLGPFLREHEKRLYSPTMFYIISTLYHLPSQLFLCAIYQVSFFWIIDIKQGWESFYKYYITFFMTYIAASGFGDILSIGIRDVTLINQAFPLVAVPLFMVSGFLGTVKEMVFYLVGFSYLSFFKFSFQAGVLIEFDDDRVAEFLNECTIRPTGCFDSSCSISTPGNPACNPLSNYDFIEDEFWLNIMYLGIHAIGFRIIAAFIFCMFTSDVPIPYEEFPPKDSFKDPNSTDGKLSLGQGQQDGFKGIAQRQEAQRTGNLKLNKVSPQNSYLAEAEAVQVVDISN